MNRRHIHQYVLYRRRLADGLAVTLALGILAGLCLFLTFATMAGR